MHGYRHRRKSASVLSARNVCARSESPQSAQRDASPHHPHRGLSISPTAHPGVQRRVGQVGISLGGANLGVLEQRPDHIPRCPAAA